MHKEPNRGNRQAVRVSPSSGAGRSWQGDGSGTSHSGTKTALSLLAARLGGGGAAVRGHRSPGPEHPDPNSPDELFPVTDALETFNQSTEGWLLVPSSPAPTPQAPPPRQPSPGGGSTYFRRDEVWGSPGGHEPPAGVRALLLFSSGCCCPRPGSRAPRGRRCLCCREVLVANAAWHRLAYYSPARPPASRPQGTASAPPARRRRGRRDPRPRPLPTQSFGGGGKCPGSGPAGGGSGRAGSPPSSSSPAYRLPPPPLLLPRSPWGCSPAARK
ncbi:unnamed protein product [Rangifer tarandus platyrhynchus]|uniref:Uncharacterized protein n=2 Tax=Rangifer tarandus platyrhynchus TaxID=3082113 RepID=A0ACB0EUR4_RANTA|nr:unnamed protein product [Rangifer tarandus platyrhynchus]CAI9703726.1 unnamed protein product [Rangifer tarandus platyrhynchus]